MTYGELLSQAAERLRSAGNENPHGEARILLEHFAGLDRLSLIEKRNTSVGSAELGEITAAVEKRCTGFPIQYILGQWEFMGLPLTVGEGVLIPRDDTEVCVRECISALGKKPGRKLRILELCSGSGAIALALAKEYPDARVNALELSDQAFNHLCRNIALNGMEGRVIPIKADIFTSSDDFGDMTFDALISNPPYIRKDEISSLQKEVGFEPVMALDGGEDGLDFYRCIAENWLSRLAPGGIISLEIGEDQAAAVTQLLSANGVSDIRTVKDIARLDRCVAGRRL